MKLKDILNKSYTAKIQLGIIIPKDKYGMTNFQVYGEGDNITKATINLLQNVMNDVVILDKLRLNGYVSDNGDIDLLNLIVKSEWRKFRGVKFIELTI